MARQRKTFDTSVKLEVVHMIKEQGLSVQNVSETMNIGPTGDSALGDAVRRRAKWPAGHWEAAHRRATAYPTAGTGEPPVEGRYRNIKKASTFFARELK